MKLLTILCTLALMATPVLAADAPTSYVFAGGEYDNGTEGFTTTVGIASNLAGNIWLLARGQVGKYGSLETDMGYFLSPGGSLKIALIAGPSIDWIVHEGSDPIGYIVGASGVIFGYAPENIGIWAGAKYKFRFENGGQTFYQSGWQGGLWMSWGL
jgi:hypothetical protein